MVSELKESAPSFSTEHRWVREFKRGRISSEDEHVEDDYKLKYHQKSLNNYIILLEKIQV